MSGVLQVILRHNGAYDRYAVYIYDLSERCYFFCDEYEQKSKALTYGLTSAVRRISENNMEAAPVIVVGIDDDMANVGDYTAKMTRADIEAIGTVVYENIIDLTEVHDASAVNAVIGRGIGSQSAEEVQRKRNPSSENPGAVERPQSKFTRRAESALAGLPGLAEEGSNGHDIRSEDKWAIFWGTVGWFLWLLFLFGSCGILAVLISLNAIGITPDNSPTLEGAAVLVTLSIAAAFAFLKARSKAKKGRTQSTKCGHCGKSYALEYRGEEILGTRPTMRISRATQKRGQVKTYYDEVTYKNYWTCRFCDGVTTATGQRGTNFRYEELPY